MLSMVLCFYLIGTYFNIQGHPLNPPRRRGQCSFEYEEHVCNKLLHSFFEVCNFKTIRLQHQSNISISDAPPPISPSKKDKCQNFIRITVKNNDNPHN